MSTKTITIYQSTTTKSAQSKKCRLLASLRLHKTSLAEARLQIKHDLLLAKFCTETDITNAYNNITTTGSKSSPTIITIEVD